MLWLVLVVASILYLLRYTLKELNLASRNVPPGPTRLPLVGSLGSMLLSQDRKHPANMFRKMCQKYGPVVFLEVGVNYQVVIEDFETVKELFSSDIWINRFYDHRIAERAFGKELGVLMVAGDVWKEMRRFSLRTLRDFGFGKQKGMEVTIHEEITELMNGLNQQIEGQQKQQRSHGNGVVVEMRQFFTISILNILWNMIAGFRFSHSHGRLRQLICIIDKVLKEGAIGGSRDSLYTAYPILAKIMPKVGIGKSRNELTETLHQFFRELLEERRAEGTYKEEQRAFIDVFLQQIDIHADLAAANNHYTDEQFLVLVRDLFMAGSETTSNSLEFAFLYMSLNPEVQAKVQAEIDSVVGSSRFPTTMDKPKMPFTEATLLEIQRLANVIPIIVRSPCQETTIRYDKTNYGIPKGTIGIINLYSMHTNEANWPEPFKFNPNRFYDAKMNCVVNAHKILPFGSGKRVCLGEVLAKTSLFIYFTAFLQHYDFSVVPGKVYETEPMVGVSMSPKPYQLVVKQRNI